MFHKIRVRNWSPDDNIVQKEVKKNQNPFLILMTFGPVTVIIPELRQAEVNAVNITRRRQTGALAWVSV